MTKVYAIAVNTFKEAVRNRVLYVLLFFSVVIMLGAWVASTLSIDAESKIVRNLGVGAINFISLLIAVFVGIGLVYNDLDKKTIYTIVSKPISRWQFLLGKYFGLLLTIAVNVLIMTWIFGSVLHFRNLVTGDSLMSSVYTTTADGAYVYKGFLYHAGYYAVSLVKALGMGLWHMLSLGYDGQLITKGLFATSMLTIMEMSIITAFAVLFSSFSSPTLSAFLTVIVFIIGRLNLDLYLFAQSMLAHAGNDMTNLSLGQKLAYYFATGSAYICPNLAVYDYRPKVAEFLDISVPPVDIVYGLVYATMIIFIAVLVFNRRNFK
jgi:ABC-type transport system involved in multi-copper enzyme maturation permease subunit